MALDAPLLQLLAPCIDSRTSPRRFSHDDYSVITKAASLTIITCTRRDATYKASQFYHILPFSPPSLHRRTGGPPLPIFCAAIAHRSAVGLRDAIGKLSAAELFSSRTAVPKVKQAMKKSLNGKIFIRKTGRSARNKAKQVHRTTAFYHTQVMDAGFVAYARYLALSTEGRLGSYAVKNTIRGFVCQVFSIWRREALQTATPDVRQQVLAYIDSEDLEEIAPLSTDEREKFYFSATDFEIMARGIFEDTEGFRTARMMLQVLYTLLLQSLSSERPGAIIESSNHFGTNEALMWRDHEFHVLPNPGDPHSPIILIRIKIHLLKGHRKSIATCKEFLLMPETHSRALFPFPSSSPWPSRTTSFLTSRQPTTSSIPEVPQRLTTNSSRHFRQ
ncbi:hypothetical protein ARMSODRAFT_980394 [Armillaria solidipes]|uniref:Uncharacterized protein n=1 Tax=Armillaria solidipes TaxID=1076256 RepID=A0A2H3AVG2_9AGAR|nr:hypothetical protein ARMSODRAFT_1025027 [Armillaria solidipes]PBK62739.1 hypothetical protein ARMSODRAFT_980394 [Armillaria solidipes]